MDDEQPKEYPPFYEKDDSIGISDNFELLTKFAMEQNLGHYGYEDRLRHLNKNLLFTNLSRQYQEPETIQKLSRAITILGSHRIKIKILRPTGQLQKIQENKGEIITKEILIEEELETRRFDRLETYISSKIFAITSTAAGSNAKLLETLKSTFLHKEQTIEDKTQTQGGLWNKVKGKR